MCHSWMEPSEHSMALLSTRPNTPGQGLLNQSGSQNCHWPATDNNEKKKLNVSWVARGCLLDWATVNYSSENFAVGKEKTEVSGYRMWGKDLVTLCKAWVCWETEMNTRGRNKNPNRRGEWQTVQSAMAVEKDKIKEQGGGWASEMRGTRLSQRP